MVIIGRFSQIHAVDEQGRPTISLFFTNKQLEDVATLASYGIQHLDVIHLVKRLMGGAKDLDDDDDDE